MTDDKKKMTAQSSNLVIHQGVLIYPERGRRCDQ